ncbi:ribokinase [Bacillus sp. 03113]|uniref:ribokinase n=1 Tax=Bacillus sp. 03113 TaxID=2578211 RepID=UPI0011417F29|nr:ribokinase [Bacillus sp. 03113]
MSPDIVVVGSLNMDMVVKVKRKPDWGETVLGSNFFMSPGGKGGNQAYAAGKLGASVAMIGQVGNDVFGSQLMQNLKKVGVDASSIGRVENEPTGVAFITLNNDADNSIIVAPGANNLVTPEYIREHKQVICQAKLVIVQLEIPLESVIEVAKIAKINNIPFMLDPAPARVLPDELYGMVDYIIPNESEISEITNIKVSDVRSAKIASVELLRKGVNTVFSKLGAKGVVVTNANRTFTIDGYATQVVDTTAAGDAFAGALATALVSGKDIWSATQFANAVGAITVTRSGAQSSMPDMEETLQFMKRFTQL